MLHSVSSSTATDDLLTRYIDREIQQSIEQAISDLIACEANRHDNVRGRIIGLRDAQAIVRECAKTWRDEDIDEESVA